MLHLLRVGRSFLTIRPWTFQKMSTSRWRDTQLLWRAPEEPWRETSISSLWNSVSLERKRRGSSWHAVRKQKGLTTGITIHVINRTIKSVTLGCYKTRSGNAHFLINVIIQEDRSLVETWNFLGQKHPQDSDGARRCLFSISSPERCINSGTCIKFSKPQQLKTGIAENSLDSFYVSEKGTVEDTDE